MDSWVGQSADSLIASWGPPMHPHQISNGGHVLEYRRDGTARVGGFMQTVPQTTHHQGSVYGPGGSGGFSGTSTTYVQQKTPAYNIQLTCVSRFVVNKNGYIQSWRAQGNNCVAKP